MRLLAAILAISLLIGCDSRATGPVPIGPDDACASCRMLISERRYAAEMLDRDGTIYKFDDIACMMRFARSRGKNSPSVRFYVMDHAGGRDWLDARNAYFAKLQSSASSPMASGLAGFRSRQAASAAAATGAEHTLTFHDLWTGDLTPQTAANPKNQTPIRSEDQRGN